MAPKSRSKKVLVRRRAVSRVLPYGSMLSGMVELLELSRRASARAVNAIMTATYWEIGRRIVNVEQHGRSRANYGEQLVRRLATDLTARFGRGFAQRNLERFRQFYLAYPQATTIASTVLTHLGTTRTSRELPIASTALTQSSEPPLAHLKQVAARFPLPWSHYLGLLSVKSETARRFYAREHWTRAGENPPVGLILCTTKNDALAQYALGDLTDRVLIREYQTTLPNEQLLADEIERTRQWLESRRSIGRAKEPE